QPYLVAVINVGGARHYHLQEGAEAQSALVATHVPQGPWRVVAVEHVELGQVDLPIVQAQHLVDARTELRRVEGQIIITTGMHVGDESTGAEEAHGRSREDVVHYRVELVALEPPLRRLPHLAHDICL